MPKYQDTPYKGSQAYNSIVTAPTWQLRNAEPYYRMAIKYHTERGNDGTAKFFSKGLELINRRLANEQN